jgi:hypothetical protein
LRGIGAFFAALAMTAIAASPASADTVTLGQGACWVTIAAGASCAIPVSFSPAAAGRRAASLVIMSIGSRSPVTVPLQGTAVTRATLGALRVSPSTFAPARRGPSIAQRGGAAVSYVSDIAGRSSFRVLRPTRGVRRGHSCVKGPRVRGARASSCTRWVMFGAAFTHDDRAGVNGFRFSGRVRVHGEMARLKPGRYRLRAAAREAGRTGSAINVAFRIVRGR